MFITICFFSVFFLLVLSFRDFFCNSFRCRAVLTVSRDIYSVRWWILWRIKWWWWCCVAIFVLLSILALSTHAMLGASGVVSDSMWTKGSDGWRTGRRAGVETFFVFRGRVAVSSFEMKLGQGHSSHCKKANTTYNITIMYPSKIIVLSLFGIISVYDLQ